MVKKIIVVSVATVSMLSAAKIAYVQNYKMDTTYEMSNSKELLLVGDRSKQGTIENGEEAVKSKTANAGSKATKSATHKQTGGYKNDKDFNAVADLGSKPLKDSIKAPTAQSAKLIGTLDYYRESCFAKKCIHGTERSDMIAWYNAGVSAGLAYDEEINKFANAFLNREAYKQAQGIKAQLPKEYYDVIYKRVLEYKTLANGNIFIKGEFEIKSASQTKTLSISSELKKIKGKYGFIQDIAIINVN